MVQSVYFLFNFINKILIVHTKSYKYNIEITNTLYLDKWELHSKPHTNRKKLITILLENYGINNSKSLNISGILLYYMLKTNNIQTTYFGNYILSCGDQTFSQHYAIFIMIIVCETTKYVTLNITILFW